MGLVNGVQDFDLNEAIRDQCLSCLLVMEKIRVGTVIFIGVPQGELRPPGPRIALAWDGKSLLAPSGSQVCLARR